jgi:hypothetical protein
VSDIATFLPSFGLGFGCGDNFMDVDHSNLVQVALTWKSVGWTSLL